MSGLQITAHTDILDLTGYNKAEIKETSVNPRDPDGPLSVEANTEETGELESLISKLLNNSNLTQEKVQEFIAGFKGKNLPAVFLEAAKKIQPSGCYKNSTVSHPKPNSELSESVKSIFKKLQKNI